MPLKSGSNRKVIRIFKVCNAWFVHCCGIHYIVMILDNTNFIFESVATLHSTLILHLISTPIYLSIFYKFLLFMYKKRHIKVRT